MLALVGAGLLVAALLRDPVGDQASAPSAPPVTQPAAFDLGAVTTAPTTPEGVGAGWAKPSRGRRALRGFGEVAGTVTAPDGTVCSVCLLAAIDEAQRGRGLMEVTDRTLGGYDGMVFVFDEPASGSFWMRNTPMPLSIAYLDVAGRAVDVFDMKPCSDSPSCPGYPPSAPFGFALEVPEGNFEALGLTKGAVLRLTATPCPLARKSG